MRDVKYRYTEVIVPAAPGYTIIYISTNADPSQDTDPRMRDQVIAWGVVSRVGKVEDLEETTGVVWTNAITPNGVAPGSGNWVLERPDGLFEVNEDATYNTLAEAAAEIRRSALELAQMKARRPSVRAA